MNIVANSPAKAVRAFTDRYRATYQPAPGRRRAQARPEPFPVLAETEDEALAIARRAYRRWWASFMALWHKHNRPPVNVSYPPEIDGQIGTAAPSSARRTRRSSILRAQLAESGANYLVCRFAYGDMTLAESLRSLELFQRHVMPALRESVAVAAE